MQYFLTYSPMEKKSQIELDGPKVRRMQLPVVRIHLSREQIFKLLNEENMDELERGQAPIYTQFVNPNLP